jgi:hypothetical protein
MALGSAVKRRQQEGTRVKLGMRGKAWPRAAVAAVWPQIREEEGKVEGAQIWERGSGLSPSADER